MAEVKLQLGEKGRGAFYLYEDEEKAGEMVVGVSGTTLTVYHTEVDPKFEGRGLAKLMLDEMVAYSGANNLKVMPLCAYVHAQFKRHAEDYKDIWKQ
ncbi:MAG TPA: GNAT family N-acetyltransferase [Dyadobacter sp.]|nr:GNAT family N-acetyltransferase [Dyadobacter sp.]